MRKLRVCCHFQSQRLEKESRFRLLNGINLWYKETCFLRKKLPTAVNSLQPPGPCKIAPAGLRLAALLPQPSAELGLQLCTTVSTSKVQTQLAAPRPSEKAREPLDAK